KYTYIGASIASVASAVILISLGMPWIGKIAPYNKKLLLTKFLKLLFSSSAMGILLYFYRDQYSILLLLPIGSAIYVVLIFAVKVISIKDFTSAIKTVFGKKDVKNTSNNV
ncbi:hypothetical protein MEO39_26675, partial [Dolichospermum sp. ST_sed2]|nr:hypothetical protein [Dolichospermum sp. ST_sed2]